MSDNIYASIPVWKPNIYDKQLQKWVPNPEPKPDLEEFYSMGLLRKSELKHGSYYLGSCRNASVARWNEEKQLFRYLRYKFGSSYEEDIPHPEDQMGYDIFTPLKEHQPDEKEIVLEGFEK